MVDPARARLPALDFANRDFPLLRPTETVRDALDKFRTDGLSHKIIYFYVVDEGKRLLGVLPTRLLLTANLNTRIEDIYVRKAVSLPASTTMDEARKAFSEHQFLAFPVVDRANHILGVLDVQPFAGRLDDVHERTGFDDVYELLGLQSQLSAEANPVAAFKMRFPWLISTIIAGSIGAVLTSFFETTLRNQIALAFFLTMTLGLNEGVCMQSATLAIQRLHGNAPGTGDLVTSLIRELRVSLFLGTACGISVLALVLVWRRDPWAGIAVSSSLLFSIVASCLWGVLVPPVLRKLQKDPKVAAGPIALALADISTLLIYFGIGNRIFG